MTLETLTIVGVGLIGGSVGLAARQRRVARRVVGVGLHRDTLDRARLQGVIDEACLDLAAAVRAADLVVFCTPVDHLVEQIVAAAPHCAAHAVLTDVGSTKAVIVHGVEERLPAGAAFVGSHPLAGSEKQGSDHATPHLFSNRVTVVTPTARTPPAALERVSAFWAALGARVHRMSPEDHDEALALTSHLPHLLASALAGLLPPHLQDLTATGFRDTTRIAAGDAALWTAIFTQNRPALLRALAALRGRLDGIEDALQHHHLSAIHAWLDQAKKVRDALGS
jgi:prephenate dehydrogenase